MEECKQEGVLGSNSLELVVGESHTIGEFVDTEKVVVLEDGKGSGECVEVLMDFEKDGDEADEKGCDVVDHTVLCSDRVASSGADLSGLETKKFVEYSSTNSDHSNFPNQMDDENVGDNGGKGHVTDERGSFEVESMNVETRTKDTAANLISSEVEFQILRECGANHGVSKDGEETLVMEKVASDVGDCVLQDSKMVEADDLSHQIQNPVTTTKAGEDYNLQSQATEEEGAVLLKEAIGGGDSFEELVSEGEGNKVPSKGKIVIISDEEEYTCSNHEGMDFDALNENLYFSLEELTSNENDCNVIADPLYQTTAGVHENSKQKPHYSFDKKITPTNEVYFSGETETKAEKIQLSAETVKEDSQSQYSPVVSNHFMVDSNSKIAQPTENTERSQVEHVADGGETKEQYLEDPSPMKKKIMKHDNANSLLKLGPVSYQLQPEEGELYCVSDLVWGKVRSHPWWPGQIFDPSDASEKALKYHKKECFLVAYFGDHTFAWNETSLLKPFRTHFSEVEKQSNSEAFHNAVGCALGEVSRRVELGLACSCMPAEIYETIRFQVVENTGIREELVKRYGVDESTGASSFQPAKLVEYIKKLAQSPHRGADQVELVIAMAQLLAFYRLEGFNQLPEFQDFEGLIENNVETGELYSIDEQNFSPKQSSSYHKRKHNLKASDYHGKKEKTLSELISDGWEDSLDYEIETDGKSAKKQKTVDNYFSDVTYQDERNIVSSAKISLIPKPSFKIGDCIRRIAPSILRCDSEKIQKPDAVGDVDGSYPMDVEKKSVIVPVEYDSGYHLLYQLHLVARNPFTENNSSNSIAGFFYDFRNSVVVNQHSAPGEKRKRMSSRFEFEDMSDTYWTDRIIQNGSEDQTSGKSRNQDIKPDMEHPIQGNRRSYAKKRYADVASQKPVGYIDENAPAELLMNFAEVESVPSVFKLNRMFKHFGPLKESESEVDREGGRARVVFRKCFDAESALSSAGKFGIFGPVAVNYQLNYTVSASFKSSMGDAALKAEHETLCLEG